MGFIKILLDNNITLDISGQLKRRLLISGPVLSHSYASLIDSESRQNVDFKWEER
jgi:hypothetical protein